MARFLLCGALVLALAAPASAQDECLKKLMSSLGVDYQTMNDTPSPGSVPSGTTIIRLANNGFYIAVNGSRQKGVIAGDSPGTYSLGNGAYYVSPDGEPTDCDARPEECGELLDNANGGGGSAPPPADPPPSSEPPPSSQSGAAPEYHYEFQSRRNGTLMVSFERRLRGVWGYRYNRRSCG